MLKKKKILISAGGTATAWHIVNQLKKYFSKNVEIHVCDINPKHLIPASIIADYYHQVLSISDNNYYKQMLDIMDNFKIDYYVPLIDDDLVKFSSDNIDLVKRGIVSSAPTLEVAKIVTNKKMLNEFLISHGFNVPKSFQFNEIKPEENYFVKPIRGFGSRGAQLKKGKAIVNDSNFIIQEVCLKPEVTVEIYADEKQVKAICRERIEVKSGVSTKARFFKDDEIFNIIKKLTKFISFPIASCVQFMKNTEQKWCITDLNLRLGAGTALSTAIGFDLTRAFLNKLLFNKEVDKYLNIPDSEKYVVRVYKEIVTL